MSEGLRWRAEDLATLELGPRSARDIADALAREIEAERWTSLDRTLERMAAEGAGEINLRPDGQADGHLHRQLLGRAAKLEVLGLAEQIESGIWVMRGDAEAVLRDLSVRGDIIKTMHRSEEHTSELQSLMRISYAVYCLTKKKNLIKPLSNIPHTRRQTIQ